MTTATSTAADPERAITPKELPWEVWGDRSLGRTRRLHSHAARLRRKLGKGSGQELVVNASGFGYRLKGGVPG